IISLSARETSTSARRESDQTMCSMWAATHQIPLTGQGATLVLQQRLSGCPHATARYHQQGAEPTPCPAGHPSVPHVRPAGHSVPEPRERRSALGLLEAMPDAGADAGRRPGGEVRQASAAEARRYRPVYHLRHAVLSGAILDRPRSAAL